MTEKDKLVTKFELRPYQSDALNEVRAAFASGFKRVVLQLPCGGGKTQIAATMIRGAVDKGRKCLFVCDRIELIDQTSKRFDAEGIPHGVIQGQHERCRPYEPVQICSIQTLGARKRWPDAEFIIQDECHSRYATMDKIIARWGNVPMVGLSATPWSKGLGKSWEHLVVGTTTGELIDLGFLVPFRVYGPDGPDLSKVKTVAGEYHEGQLAEAVDQPKLVADIVSTWLKLGEDRQTICFATNILHSRHIVAQFKEAGVKAEHIDAYSDTEERRSILKRFEDGDTRIVSSVDILTKGYDQPLASCMIDARPTKSLILHTQKTGRILRVSPGKDLAKILDHSGNTARLGFVTDEMPSELDDGKKKEAKPLERKEPLPKPCPSCNYMKPAKVYACPSCGFKPEKLNSIESAPGELVEIIRAKKENRSMSAEEKAHFYGQLKWIAHNRGYNKHWADHTYRAKLSVWPNAYKDAPMHVATPSTIAYVQSRLIRHSKRRA